MKKALNVRQERFCEFVAAGESQTDAYLKAGFKVSSDVAKANASRLLANANVQARLAELRKKQTRKALMTRDEKREKLRQIVENESIGIMAKLRAIELDAKLAGDFAPEQIHSVVDAGPNTMDMVRERARAMASPLAREIAPIRHQ